MYQIFWPQVESVRKWTLIVGVSLRSMKKSVQNARKAGVMPNILDFIIILALTNKKEMTKKVYTLYTHKEI